MLVNIEGLDKAAVLAALYNNARVQGYGFLQAKDGDMPIEEARALLSQSQRFDYLHGRVMKVSLRSNVDFDAALYDRDNGPGEASRVVRSLRVTAAV